MLVHPCLFNSSYNAFAVPYRAPVLRHSAPTPLPLVVHLTIPMAKSFIMLVIFKIKRMLTWDLIE